MKRFPFGQFSIEYSLWKSADIHTDEIMLSEIIEYAIFEKARAVATKSDHPLSTFFRVHPSQRRCCCIKCKTSRYSRSVVPVAIRMLNAR